MPKAIDKRFVEYLLELTDGVTGRIIDVLRRGATHSLTLRSKTIGLEELQHVGARLPTIMNQRALNLLKHAIKTKKDRIKKKSHS